MTRHRWTKYNDNLDRCSYCGLLRKRGAIRLPLNSEKRRKWHSSYLYVSPENHLEVYSKAPSCDGKEKTQKSDKDKT